MNQSASTQQSRQSSGAHKVLATLWTKKVTLYNMDFKKTLTWNNDELINFLKIKIFFLMVMISQF
jgi:hypothetical protein